MKVQRGNVVVVEFPHSTGQGSSLRPALVVQSDHNNRRIHNTIVAQITSKLRHLKEPTRLLVDPSTPAGKSSGLHMVSLVTCENLLTLREEMIYQVIGHLSDELLLKVNACLKAALDLP